MGDHGNPDLTRDLPRLREQCKSSYALSVQAVERARRAADTARAMRSLLQSHTPSKETPTPEAWRTAAEEVVHMSRDRDAALGILSHELRQGLNAALAAEALLTDTRNPDIAASARGVLHRQLLHMSRLIENLLDFSRLSFDGRRVERQPLDLRDVLARAVEGIDAAVTAKGLHLSIAQPDEPQVVSGDAMRLQQVVSNILHNALRYTPRGGSIGVTIRPAAGEVTLEVKDSGAGIDPQHLSTIFEPFKRQSIDGPGLGVGLALTKRLVEVHGGSIAVQSQGRDLGSVFSVRLPLAPRS
jgi:two-component system, sensor histidine kinase